MQDYTQIPGWGIDSDPANEPTYPMRTRTGGEHEGMSWTRPSLQAADVEVLHSNERPNLTAVFGTTCPPSGLSGLIRRAAFKFSESSYGHWLPLMLADRIGVVEGIAADLGKGRVPNLFAEAGWTAEWKYNRKNLVVRIFLYAAAGSLAVALLKRKRSSLNRADS